MIKSRALSDLLPHVHEMAVKLIANADAVGIDILVTSTYRDFEAQAELYAQGRTKPGPLVTNAHPGQSWHNWRRAFDVVPMRNGKPIWDASNPIWTQIGLLGEELGLEWAGRWKKFPEFPHFQYTEGLTLAGLLSQYPRGIK